jgi:ABC-type transport system involved in cytochrome c biogenesis permease subunit
MTAKRRFQLAAALRALALHAAIPGLVLAALVVPGLALLPSGAFAQSGTPSPAMHRFAARDLRELKLVVVQQSGRNKPLDTLARENVQFITEKHRYKGQEPLATYLSWVFEGDKWMDEPMVRVQYLPLRREAGLDLERTLYSANELRSNEKLMALFRTVDAKERASQKLDKNENEAKNVGTKLLVLNEAMSGEALRIVPNPMNKDASWFTLQEAAQAPFFDTATVRQALGDIITAFEKDDGAGVAAGGATLRTALGKIAPTAMPSTRAIQSEYRYNTLNPFQKAWILYFIAFVLLLLAMTLRAKFWYWGGLAALLTGFALHVYGMALRVIVAGRPPVSNIYESMIFVAAAILLFALVFEAIYRSRIFALTAAGLGVVALVLAENLPVSSEIAPLVPVLRSTTWLTFHVLTILMGYSGAFLAGGLAFVGLGCYALGRGTGPLAVRLDKFHYRVVQVTVLFLGAGIILGGVWANQSWGRYWGWDPKETWALISLLVYLVIIHGRFAGWLKRFGTNVASVIGLNMVIMTYYGVNYFLVGLHSYAGGTAFHVPVWVYLFLLAEVIFVLLAYFGGAPSRRRKPNRPAVGDVATTGAGA